jgi:cyclopropane-fatty-acyl-phospholipid synthase
MTVLYLEALAAIAASLSVLMASGWLVRQHTGNSGWIEKEWRWSGVHYQRTALDWLGNFDSHRDEIERILRKVYGNDTPLWMRRWR